MKIYDLQSKRHGTYRKIGGIIYKWAVKQTVKPWKNLENGESNKGEGAMTQIGFKIISTKISNEKSDTYIIRGCYNV